MIEDGDWRAIMNEISLTTIHTSDDYRSDFRVFSGFVLVIRVTCFDDSRMVIFGEENILPSSPNPWGMPGYPQLGATERYWSKTKTTKI